MIVTIDGPAGAGKSSAAKGLASRLGFDFLDTGATFRAVTLAALQAGIDTTNQEALTCLVAALRIDMPAGQVILNGTDVSEAIRTQAVSAATSDIASSAVVRRRLAKLQRHIAAGRNMVCEGRDQGTVVFPDAVCKFFLFADPVERAHRRHRELSGRGEIVSFETILQAQERRDRRDAGRDLAPMVPAADAILLDSTHLSLDEVVSAMEQKVRQCLPG